MNSDPRSPLCCTLRQSDAASAACVPLQTRSQCRRKRGRKLCKLLWADYFDQLLFFLLNQRSAWESQSRLYMSVAYAEAAPRALAFFLPKRGEVKHEALRLSNAPKGAQGDGNSFCFFAFCTVAPRQATCCCFSGLFPRKGVHLHASNYWILLLSMMKYSREKNWAKRLPRQCVHSMALGGVIKHMGWKLSRFTLCSQGWCCGFFFFFWLLLQSEIYSWTQSGGQPAPADVCPAHPPDVAVTLLPHRPRAPAAAGCSSSPSLPLSCHALHTLHLEQCSPSWRDSTASSMINMFSVYR